MHAPLRLQVLDEDRDAYTALLSAAPAFARQAVLLAAAPAEADGAADIALGQPDRVAAALRAGQRYRWVQSTWAGITPLLADDLPRDYALTGLAGIFGPWMAEYVLAYLLLLDQRIDRRRAAQRRGEWAPRLPRRLGRRRIAIIGTGDIGTAIACALLPFGCAVTGVSRSGDAVAGFARVLPVHRLHEALAACDTFVCTLPDTPATRGLLDATAFAALPAGAVFLNVGRGSVVDEQALVEALQSGRLAHAVLDVTRHEPLPAGNPLWSLPNVELSFHTAGPSRPDEIVPLFLDNLERFAVGAPLRRRVDFERGY
jgi:phosphoglycerate dehydrogenase-like enzyme